MVLDVGFFNKVKDNLINIKKVSKKIIIISIVFILLGCLILLKRDAIIIYGLSKFNESKIPNDLNETARKSLKLLNLRLDKYIKELEPNEDVIKDVKVNVKDK
jgi:hypothetical protein